MALKEVTIKNGDMKAKVAEKSVKAWETAGWTVVEDGSDEAEAAPAPAKKAAAKKEG